MFTEQLEKNQPGHGMDKIPTTTNDYNLQKLPYEQDLRKQGLKRKLNEETEPVSETKKKFRNWLDFIEKKGTA